MRALDSGSNRLLSETWQTCFREQNVIPGCAMSLFPGAEYCKRMRALDSKSNTCSQKQAHGALNLRGRELGESVGSDFTTQCV